MTRSIYSRARLTHLGCRCGALVSEKAYSEKHDALYCDSCRRWLESKCPDPACSYCANRPEQAPL